jgi:polyisoprenoid-binding protein YceI
LLFASCCFAAATIAEPITYQIDPSHTYPSFEADHFHGLSIWRGKVNTTSGTIVMDREAETGSVEAIMEMASIDFGHQGMNETAWNDILHVQDIPTARYAGTLTNFENGAPTAVDGRLTLHGVTMPLDLSIDKFQCQPHFRTGLEVCGADASASFDRSEYGLDRELDRGFFPEVRLLISVEASPVVPE